MTEIKCQEGGIKRQGPGGEKAGLHFFPFRCTYTCLPEDFLKQAPINVTMMRVRNSNFVATFDHKLMPSPGKGA
jgi:hypothetical protein